MSGSIVSLYRVTDGWYYIVETRGEVVAKTDAKAGERLREARNCEACGGAQGY
jgi:hypothetical protein